MVLTGAGLVAIETIKAGDKVIATNPETNQTEEKTVVETYINQTECIVHLHIKNEVINTTKNHPFYVKEKGFVEACELSKGDEIMNASGGSYLVERIEFEDKEETVYNFQVEDYHTYYVGESSVLVHNADCGNSNNAKYVEEKRVPLDKETVLNKDAYIKTKFKVKGAAVYKKGDKYYYRDTLHKGERAHLEVFDKKGNHIGEANPVTGELIRNTADKSKKIVIK